MPREPERDSLDKPGGRGAMHTQDKRVAIRLVNKHKVNNNTGYHIYIGLSLLPTRSALLVTSTLLTYCVPYFKT